MTQAATEGITPENETASLKDDLTTLQVQFARALQTVLLLTDRVAYLEEEVESIKTKLRAATGY
jgi:hypothetical protein